MELKTFILYFFFAFLPLCGIVLYVALLALERERKERMARGREMVEAMHAGRPVTAAPGEESADGEPAVEGPIDKELEGIKKDMLKKEKESTRGDTAVDKMKEKMESADPAELGRMLGQMIEK